MKVVKSLRLGLAAAAVLALAGCQEGSQQLSHNNKHYTPISSAMMATLSEKGVGARSPMLIRAYKQESELEVWKQNASGEYVLVKTFPMCRWSGQLGPKKREGDRQVPEGFYAITQGQLNPNSSYYLSFNVGYPNAYDKAHGRTGALIMVHGACSSMGCYSMTDQQIAEIYALARESFSGGQAQIQMQSYPFRFTPDNLAKYRADPNMPFWKMLKEGSDSFDVTKRETRVSVCDRKYVFNRSQSGACAPDQSSPVVAAVARKAQGDDQKVAELSTRTPAVRRMYSDGDQHPSFKHTRYADASATSSTSRPEALQQGPVEIAVADAPAAVSPAPAKVATRTAAASRPVAAVTTPAPQAEQQASTPSFFRKWVSGDEPAARGATTAEAPKPAPAAIKAKTDSKAKKPKPVEKTAETPAAVPESGSIFGNLVAQIPGWR